MNNVTQRTGYADRDAVIDRLRVAAGDGMLDPDELDTRIEAPRRRRRSGSSPGLLPTCPRPHRCHAAEPPGRVAC